MISVIIPFYNGNKYLKNLMQHLNNLAKQVYDDYNDKIEIIIINDSPEISVDVSLSEYKYLNIKINVNSYNSGIHKSRINGLKVCTNDYIIFLDQDDLLINNAFLSYYKIIKENERIDMILSNGYLEYADGKDLIFGNQWDQLLACKKSAYLKIRDFIASPGQCCINRNKIPKHWIQNIMKNNGTDDYLLWLLMFEDNLNIYINPDILYSHTFTGENLSDNNFKMRASEREMMEILSNKNIYSPQSYKTLKRARFYKEHYKKNVLFFILLSLKNLDLFIYNVYYRIRWKGALKR